MSQSEITLSDDVIITTAQASKLLSTPESTLNKWRSTGENNIPYLKIGRNVRYRTTELKKWVDAHMIVGDLQLLPKSNCIRSFKKASKLLKVKKAKKPDVGENL